MHKKKEEAEEKTPLRKGMLRYFLHYRGHIIALAIFIVVEPLLNSFLNLWLARLFDSAVVGENVIIIVRLLIIGFSVWISKRIVIFIMDTVKNNLLCNIRHDIKRDAFVNVLNKNTFDITEQGGSGEYASLFINDINIFEERYYGKIVDFVTYCVAVVINAAAFIHLNYKLALAILLFGILVAVVPLAVSRKLNESNYKYSETLSKFTQKLKEFFTAYPAIKNYAVEKGILQAFDGVNLNTENSKFQAEYELNLANCIGAMLSWFMQIVAIGLGLMMVVRGEILVGTVIAARSFASDLAQPLQGAIGNLNSIKSVKDIARKIDRMTCDSGQESVAAVQTSKIPEKSDIAFEGVSLTVGDKKIVNNFSFTFGFGKKYLIIGKNGAGKSTIFKLLKNKYRDYSGQITLGGVPLEDISNDELAKNVSYLTESVVLLGDDIADNIRFFRDIPDEKLRAAFESAQISIDSSRRLLDGGSNVSSGEQRRIEIARSMCGDAQFLIFDEVISVLDVKTAYEIEKMVLDYDKTVVFISHNFSGRLIKEYDEILLMEGGELIAHGSYDQLIESNQEFREICSIKFGVE